jgi:hypothetical protein
MRSEDLQKTLAKHVGEVVTLRYVAISHDKAGVVAEVGFTSARSFSRKLVTHDPAIISRLKYLRKNRVFPLKVYVGIQLFP